MVAFGMILWGLALLALLHLAVPNHYMRSGECGNGAYYLYWGAAVTGALMLMYHIMRRYGLVQPYMVTSSIVICAYAGWRGLLWTLHERWCRAEDDRRQDTDAPAHPPVDHP